MAQKKAQQHNRRKAPTRRPLLPLLLVLLVLVALLAFLEHLRFSVKPGPRQGPPPVVTAVPAKPAPEPPSPEHARPQPPSQPAPVPAPEPTGAGTVAVIVDDMGGHLEEARQLLAIGVPLTLAVIPGLPHARQVATYAHEAGGEIMVHMPMEPKDYPQRPLEANGLLMAHGDDEIARRVISYFQAIPHAAGANNHMGSRFTEDQEKMATVLGILRQRQLYFVDSLTSERSVGYPLARELGIRAQRRDVFLDNVQDEAAIIGQLRQVAAIARRRGSAVAICHPHPATIRALARHLPVMKSAGIRFVPVSALVR
jgi:polysaccharide deacetylase 2 family uncharacterized protein YibQ